MSDREAFEAHFRAAWGWNDGRFYHWPEIPGASCTGQYTDDRTQWAWFGWQAAREAAIGECAAECTDEAAGSHSDIERHTAEDCGG